MSKHYLGIDLGSSYTKFAVIDDDAKVEYMTAIPTLSRRWEEYDREMKTITERFNVLRTCATGYGRKSVEVDMRSTELICAAAGASLRHPIHKRVLDIGGEDIKIIECDKSGGVINFFMNDKCSAGTGTFITEIAERAELKIDEMSELCGKSTSTQIMNSFCTVFAKSEILSWKFNGTPIEDIARGIYLSVVDRICKLPLNAELPLFLCGGVIAYHGCLEELLREALDVDVQVIKDPQYTVALGAAALAHGGLAN